MRKLPQYHTESQWQNIWSRISRIQQCHLGRPVISNIYPYEKKKYIGQLTECSLVPWGDWHPLLRVINTTTLKTGPVLQVIFFSDEEMKHQWDETDRQSHSKPRVLSLTEKTWEETFSLTHNHHGISCKYKLEVLGGRKVRRTFQEGRG